jgi:ppGpp synthetase/RelA/SpoT-type nucleotidyltranferase
MNFDEYERKRRPDFKAFAEAIAVILEAAIKADPAYRLQQIQRREKSPTSLKAKLAKFNASDSDKIEDVVKDLAACRVIFYTNADVKRFLSSDILRSNFIIDWDRTKVHHPVPGTESEGRFFISDNIVVRLNEQRASAPEYARFRSMLCEIQVQTTLNHAWSEMEHDVYKIKPAVGFGKDLLKEIQKRFDKVMREMLIPAGYEFQTIVDDYNRLASGRELFDRGALKVLAECKDNNERHELLERFKTYVLPHLDDPARAHAEIRHALVACVQAARATATEPISTPWGDLPGRTVEDVVELAAEVLDQLRYVSIEAVEVTLDALCELYPGAASDKEREQILNSVKTLATHNYEVWRAGGPIVQDILVRRIRGWDRATLDALRPVALTVLEQVLRPEATGTSATYKTITLTTAEVVPSEALTRIRATSLDLLEELFRSAPDDTERCKVKQVLLDATRFPQRGGGESPLRLTILKNSARVARFFGDVAHTLSHELLQTLEQSFLWLYRHTHRPADALAEDEAIAAARRVFIEAIFAFRDRINANRDFVVYKTLVGFESVFPPEWEGDPMDHASEEAYRNGRINEFVAEVDAANADAWLKILQRCASTKSNDLATFPSFGRFLEDLARAKPEIIDSYFDRLGDDLANFLPAMLRGMEGTARWPAAKARIDQWVSERRYLSQILWHQRFTDKIEVAVVKQALARAVEDANDRAVLNAAEICAARSDAIPREEIGTIFTSAISYLKSRGNTNWADAIWAHFVKGSLAEALSAEQIDLVLSALVERRRVDHHAEYVLVGMAKRFPEKVIDFFGARLRHRDEDEVVEHYEAVPYRLTTLGRHLALTGPYLIAQSRAWHRENAEFFEYRGGRLLPLVFPEFTPELEGLLKEVLATGGAGAARCVADVLAGYRGSPATHELYKLIVEAVPEGDPVLGAVEVALISTGVVSGEFGMVQAYQRKKAEIQPWLCDSRPRVKAYAEAYDRMLDRMIAAEQRRSEEDLEARKRQYGDGMGQAGDSTAG